MNLEVLYQDDYFIAINKPCGLLVHRTRIAEENELFALQILREQTGRYLYPIHRIDRPTSGVLLFAFSSEIARHLGEMFTQNKIHKEYQALVRGWFPDRIELDFPVKNDRGNLQSAQTDFQLSERFVMHYPLGEYSSCRYSRITCYPHSGRWHQIRQHLAHLRHYIINDRVHGDGKHNRIFKNELLIEPFFLHARSLELSHPVDSTRLLHIEAPFPEHWDRFRELKIVESLG